MSTKQEDLMPDGKIESALIKENITISALAEMKKFKELTVKDINDKEGLKEVHDARIMCKNTRLLAAKVCKAGRENAIAEQKAWIAKEKEITGEISEIEDYLQQQEDVVENEKKRIKEEKEKAEQLRIQTRTAQLLKCGMSFNGEEYLLGELKITATQVKLFDDFTYNSLFAQVEAAYKVEEQRKAEVEAEQKRVAEDQLKQKEELDKKEREQAAKAQELADRETKLKKHEEEQEEKRLAEAKRMEEEKRRNEEIQFKQRGSMLHTLGMSFNGDKYIFQDIIVPVHELRSSSAEEFDKIISDITPKIATKRFEVEKKRNEEIEASKQHAIEKAKWETEERIKREQEEKRLAEEKRIQEEEHLVTLKPDKEKFMLLGEIVNQILMPEMSTEAGKAKMIEVKANFTKMVNYLKATGEALK